MPSPKKKNRSVKKAGGSNPSPLWLYVLAAFLLAGGQVLTFKGVQGLGILFSLLGLLLFGAVYSGWVQVPAFSLPDFGRRKASAKPKPVQFEKSKVSSKTIYRVPKVAASLTLWGFVRLGLILGAFYFAIRGQMDLINMVTTEGVKFYFIGVLLFTIATLFPQREGLKLVPITPKVEWTLFGLIMVLAAFLRIYKLDTIPSGVFFDMGFQGYEALRILHEHIHPWEMNITENFPSAPVPIYVGAIWFMFFKNTQFNLNLLYVTFCLASFPLIYWTFRQLSGPRVALLAFYILAVMRWNMIFCRNSFPPSLLPFFMFGTLALLLYGLRTNKRWAFIVAGVLFPIGLYAYQTYVMYLVAVFLFALYECATNWKAVKANLPSLGMFTLIFLLLSFPFFKPMFTGQSTTRINQLSIFNRCQQEHSIQPLLVNLQYTALMFNRRGDPNPRHNLQDHRELDDVTGVLFFFGVFYALFRCWRRKHYYTLVGIVIMALPCLITVDPAHSSRMHGMTAFIALAAASTLSAIWGRLRALWGQRGEWLFLLLLAAPLAFMAKQNYQVYFVEEANNYGSWAEFSIAESTIGKKCAQWGDKYDCYISGRYYGHYTVEYFTYFVHDHVKRMDIPDSFVALPAAGRGLLFALEQGRSGVLGTLEQLYPGGESEIDKDPTGNAYLYFYRVPPEIVDKARGLKAKFSDGTEAQIQRFPESLPAGPFNATFTGDFYVDMQGPYRFTFPAGMSWWIAGQRVLPGKPIELQKGYFPLKIKWSAPNGATGAEFSFDGPSGKMPIGPSHFLTFPQNRGLKAEYFESMEWKGKPTRVQWEPVINYVNGNDFPFQGGSMGIHWSGQLNVPKGGEYRFYLKTMEEASLKIDHKPVTKGMGSNPQGKISLTQGTHAIDVYYAKQNGWGADFSLMWGMPDERGMEVIPNSAFGLVP